MMVKNISLDIEACGEVVVSVGACVFDAETGEPVGTTFYEVLDPQAQIDRGLKMDGGAFLWWLRQSNEARKSITEADPLAPAEAFNKLREWWPDRNARTWCYPTSYDLPVLHRAMTAFGVRPPWKWTETMCMRTLWKLACDHNDDAGRIEKEAAINEHNALADALQQARWAAKYLAILRRPR